MPRPRFKPGDRVIYTRATLLADDSAKWWGRTVAVLRVGAAGTVPMYLVEYEGGIRRPPFWVSESPLSPIEG